MRLVLVSFALLALAFYELSGGSDFEPPEPPKLAQSPIATKATPPRNDATTALKSAQAETVAASTPPVSASVTAPVAAQAKPATPSAQLTKIRASLSQGLTLVSDATPGASLSLASLEMGASGLRPSAESPPAETSPAAMVADTGRDLREIIGTRVNMRDGPGTIYPVIGRVRIGQKVEVLSESGTGWLRLRTLPEQQLGWISASLVSKPDR